MIQHLAKMTLSPTHIAQMSEHKKTTAKCRPDRKCKRPNLSADTHLVVQPRHPFIKQQILQQLAQL